MPVLEAPLVTYLTSALTGDIGDRLFPVRGAEGTSLPYVTYQRVGANRTYTHDPFEMTTAWVRARIRFTIWATTMLQATQIGEALVLALSGYEGDMEGLNVGSGEVILELDEYQADVKLYRRVVDVTFTYEEGGAGS